MFFYKNIEIQPQNVLNFIVIKIKIGLTFVKTNSVFQAFKALASSLYGLLYQPLFLKT